MAAVGEQDLFVMADRYLRGVVGRIGADAWDSVVPPGPGVPPDRARTVRDLVKAVAHDDAWVPDMVAGRSLEQVGVQAYDGDLLGDEPAAAFDRVVERACSAVLEAGDLDRTAHCSFGEFTVREYLWQVTSYRGLQGWDLTGPTGTDRTMPPDLVQGMWDQLQPVVDQWREMGVFPPAVPVPADAPLQDRLLGLTGRDPG